MGNVFKDFDICESFDLKGSTQGRNLLKPGEDLEMRQSLHGKTAMKDLDFLRFFVDSIVLDETNEELSGLLQKTFKFHSVIERDT